MQGEVRAATGDGQRPAGDTFGRRRGFAWRKLHALSGIAPLGVFLVGHLAAQIAALGGREAYDAARTGPLQARWVEIVFVLVPLAFHAAFGVFLTFRGRILVDAYPLERNWMYVAQRVTGVVTLAFVVWHVAHLWVPEVSGEVGAHQMYRKLEEDLSATTEGFPLTAVGMMAGLGAACFHFANGVWRFVVGCGLARSLRTQRRLAAASVVLGLALFFAGADTVIYFATGTRIWVVRGAVPSVARGEP